MENEQNAGLEPQSRTLGREGETQFDRLRASLELGEGFELFFCGFDAPTSFEEVTRRLAASPPSGTFFHKLPVTSPDDLFALPDKLIAIGATEKGRKVIFVGLHGREEELKGAWAESLRRLNERRNITMRECPHAVILAGPSWLPWLAHDTAPDLWSVRTAIFTFPTPPAENGSIPSFEITPWRSGRPMAHELQPPEYYEELAAALEGSRRPGEQETRGRLLLCASASWELQGNYDSAMDAANKASEVFSRVNDELMVALCKGYTADILGQRGDTDEALRIRYEEQLPVYERLGDVCAKAVTMGKIADILMQRGKTDAALRIRYEEELPVYERLGDVREKAVTMGKIADILQQRGETDEALRILREEVLPVMERLGDVRAKAQTMGKIADILQQREETDEALRILREEVSPVMERLGDVRAKAVTMGNIADILDQRGETDEALRIWQEEVLPVMERLGDVRAKAQTMVKIADILQKRGEADEALRIYGEECLPVAKKISDVDTIAHIRCRCALIRLNHGGWEKGEAQAILEELKQSYTLNQKIQRTDGIAFVGILYGQVLVKAGKNNEAFQVLEKSAAAFDKLGRSEDAGEARALQEQIRKRSE